MERELFFRVGALLDNLEENLLYIAQEEGYKKFSNLAAARIKHTKETVEKESNSTDDNRVNARFEVNTSLESLRAFIESLNIQSDGLYRPLDKQSSVMDHVNNRYSLISRLISEVRSRIDREHDGPKLVPRESPAPIRVVINNQRLELIAPKHHLGSVPDPSVDKLRQAARDILRRAMAALAEAGNADPRFLPCCEGLTIELSAPLDQMSVEAVGLNWQIVSEALEISQDSLPDLIIAQIRRALTTINVILGQYEEWQSYLTAEAGTKLSSADVTVLAKQALTLIDDFSEVPEAADSRIADRIRMIVDPMATGIVQSDTIGVPLVGSLSNIFAALSHAALESLPGGATVTGQISGGLILTNLSLVLIDKFAPTLSLFPPLSWMNGVQKELAKNWGFAKDTIKI